MGTFIVGVIIVAIVSFIIAGMMKDKKNGKSIQCGNDCKHCHGHCSYGTTSLLAKSSNEPLRR